MLSTKSFNALLKTIEEPPSHVKFLMATTEPEKLPDTILSRCLHFKLASASGNTISDHLSYILKKEKIDYIKHNNYEYFIDDLEEIIFSEELEDQKGILFSHENLSVKNSNNFIAHSWEEISNR